MNIKNKPKNVAKCKLLKSTLLACLAIASSLGHAEIIYSAKVMGPVSNIYATSPEGKTTKLTSDKNWRDIEASKSSSGDIVFLSNRKKESRIDLNKTSDSYNIFLLNTKNDKLTQLTKDNKTKRSPSFSPNGKWIAYRQPQPNNHAIILINKASLETKTLVTKEQILDYSWAPNGEKIVIAAIDEQRPSLTTVHVNSGHEKAITLPLKGRQPLLYASWSPSGKHIAYVTTSVPQNVRKLFVYTLDDGKTTGLSDDKTQIQTPISWHPTGNKIAYAGLQGYKFYWDEKNHKKVYEGEMNIFVTDLQGGSQQVTQGQKLHNRPTFSPDGNSIAFLFGDSLGARDLSLKTIKADGTGLKQLHTPVPGSSTLRWYK